MACFNIFLYDTLGNIKRVTSHGDGWTRKLMDIPSSHGDRA